MNRICSIFSQQPSQVPLIERDHMIQQVAPHTAHPTLGHPILPRTAESGADRLAAHSLPRRSDIDTQLGIAVEEQEALRLLASSQVWRSCSPTQTASGLGVTLQCRIRRRSWAITKKPYRTPKVRVGTVTKSVAAMASRWLRRNVNQCWARCGASIMKRWLPRGGSAA